MTGEQDEQVRFTVQMPKKLREDAKRNSDRGELSEDTRELFRQRAYGVSGSAQQSELAQVKAELRDVRATIDDLRHQRSQIDAKINAEEQRATRLEERVTNLEDQRSEIEQSVQMLENMLHAGERMWPTRIKNAADVDEGTAQEILSELKSQNPELPDAAFHEPGIHDPTDWREQE
jgi:septal ring factor EnvC (AmiA/AmiB activator)